MNCQWHLENVDGQNFAVSCCGFRFPHETATHCFARCRRPRCQYLGSAVQRDGVAVTVKCSCRGGTQDVFLPAHKCDVFHRCLPSANMSTEQLVVWGERHESAFYAICQLCPLGVESS